MRIALIEPERADSKQPAPETLARWASAEALVAMGHEARIVTRSAHARPAIVIRGRLSEHATPRLPFVGSDERTARAFSAAAAKRVWEWHEADEIDVVEAPACAADELALLSRTAGGGPPLVVSASAEDVEITLGRALADDVIPALASPGDRLAAYSAAVARRWTLGLPHPEGRAAALGAWRGAQAALMESVGTGDQI